MRAAIRTNGSGCTDVGKPGRLGGRPCILSDPAAKQGGSKQKAAGSRRTGSAFFGWGHEAAYRPVDGRPPQLRLTANCFPPTLPAVIPWKTETRKLRRVSIFV